MHRVILGLVIFNILPYKAMFQSLELVGGEILLLGNRRDPWFVLGK